MKRHFLTLTLAAVASIAVWASNTKVNGIFYTFDDATQSATVTYRGASYSSYANEYEGNVVVPAKVKHNGKIYTVSAVGVTAFSGCTTLKSVELPATIKKINGWAFDGCSALESVVLKEGIDTIGTYAFNANKNLKSVVLPNSLIFLGTYAFNDCAALESVTIGEGLKKIDKNVFLNCKSIKTLALRAAEPPTFAATSFSPEVFAANVVVPCGAERAYKAADWKHFASVKADLVWTLDVVSDNDEQGSVKVVKANTCKDDNVVFAAEPALGYAFKSWNDGNTDNPRRMKLDANTHMVAKFIKLSDPVAQQVEIAKAEADEAQAAMAAKVNDELAKAEAKRQAEEAKAAKEAERVAAKAAKAENKAKQDLAKAEEKAKQEQAKAEEKLQQEQAKVEEKKTQVVQTSKNVQTTVKQATTSKSGVLTGSDGKMYSIKAVSGDRKMGSVDGSKKYMQGTEAVLTAIPKTGYHFTRWQDGSVINPRTIIVTTNAEYVADFAISQYKLELSVDSGINGNVVGAGSYKYKDKVTISANPNEGYRFIKWSDGNTTATRIVTVTEDMSLKAFFQPLSYDVVTSVNGDREGHGKVTGAGNYLYNKTVTLTAVPDSGYHFAAWNDGVNTNPRVFAATKNISYEATFAPNLYLLDVETEDVAKGLVTGAGEYPFQQKVNISAVPEYGYSFAKWSDGSKENPRVINVVGPARYTASFIINQYELKALSGNLSKGVVTGSGTYEYNSMINIEAIPQKGYYFVKWSDDNTDNPRLVTVSRQLEYTATFAEQVFRIDAKSDNSLQGKVLGAGSYRFGSNVLLRADAADGYQFVKWSDGNTDNPRTITVEEDKELSATFAIRSYTLKASVDFIDRGTIKGNGVYEFGQIVTLEAVARQGYHFTHWSDGNTENPRQVTMLSDYEYQAQFDLNKYIMRVSSASDARGKAIGSGEYLYNYTATIRATPTNGFHFDAWSDGNTENPRNITMNRDVEFEAQFSADMYVVAVKSSDINRGTVAGAGTFEYMYSAEITANPKNGYHFDHWNDNVTANPRKVHVEEDVTYTAYFEPNVYTLSVKSNNNGFGYVSGAGDYEFNSAATLRAVAATGYRFAKWNDGNTQNPRKITIAKHESYEAEFVPLVYTLTVTSSDSHKGTVKGSGTYDFQATTQVEATAKKGYHFVHWSDGSTQNPRNFIIKGNAAFEAVFVADRYDVLVKSNDVLAGDVQGSGTFEYNTSISISATPADGYRFVQWSDGSKQNPRAVTVTGDVTYTAEFEVDRIGR